jgi:hypothetical protein
LASLSNAQSPAELKYCTALKYSVGSSPRLPSRSRSATSQKVRYAWPGVSRALLLFEFTPGLNLVCRRREQFIGNAPRDA